MLLCFALWKNKKEEKKKKKQTNEQEEKLVRFTDFDQSERAVHLPSAFLRSPALPSGQQSEQTDSSNFCFTASVPSSAMHRKLVLFK